MPIFVVLTEQGPLPGYLRDFSTGSVKDVDRLVRAIRAATEPLSDPERDILTDVYTEVGVPSEDLILDPEAAARLTEQFNRRARSTLGSERLIRELVRLRKSGHLPRLRLALCGQADAVPAATLAADVAALSLQDRGSAMGETD